MFILAFPWVSLLARNYYQEIFNLAMQFIGVFPSHVFNNLSQSVLATENGKLAFSVPCDQHRLRMGCWKHEMGIHLSPVADL